MKRLMYPVAIFSFLASCHKDRTDYAIAAAGAYVWHHEHVVNTPFLDTTYHYADTIFAVNAVDRRRVRIGTEILELSRSDGHQYTFVLQGDVGDSKSLVYNRETKKLTFSVSNHISAAGNTHTTYQSF